jgi:hypothetical protein
MMLERRLARRANARLLCNQYIDGHPNMGEALELSTTGMLVRRILGPEDDRACYAFELGHVDRPEERFFVCGSPVWRDGAFEAIRFVAQSETDKQRLSALVQAIHA